MRFSRDIVEAIRSRCEIEDLIGSYVTLKRAGSNYVGLCPFHSEKSPSFTVFPATQSYFCFGCEAGGDAITFIMQSENLDYAGAVEVLAKRTGVNLPANEERVEKKGLTRKRTYDMNLAAARFFRECLFDPKIGREGMAYLSEKRGLSPAVIKHFGLGYAPNEFGALINTLRRQGFTDEEMKEGFLCGISQKTGRPYDYFRNRVMFPIIDVAGNIVGFGGRAMDDQTKPKYLNSSDTPGFEKKRNLFALNYAKNHAEEELILCEGYMDVIALHAAGFEQAVASLGTALTSTQARMMAKYTKRVVICYDSDAAGQRAAMRAIQLLGEAGLDVRVLKMAGAKDPDEYIKTYGADRFAQLLKKSQTDFEFKLTGVLSRYDLSQPDEKIKAAAELCDVIAEGRSSAEREVYIAEVAHRIGLSEDSLRSDVAYRRKRMLADKQKKEGQEARLTALGVKDRINPQAAGSVQATAAEEAILGLLLVYEEHRTAVVRGTVPLTADDFYSDFAKRVFEAIMALQTSEEGFAFSLLGEQFDPDEMGRLTRCQQKRWVLSENGTSVLRASVEALRQEKERMAAHTADPVSGIQQILAKKRAAKQPNAEPSDQ